MKWYKPLSYLVNSRLARKKSMQRQFMLLHRFAIGAMNYGFGSRVQESGEKKAIEYIAAAIQNDKPVIFDVGANVGGYTKTLLDFFNNNPVIYCFEPSANTFKKLQANTAGFNNVILNHMALSNAKGSAVLFGRENNNEIASLVNTQANSKYGKQTQEVVVLDTIDNYCTENGIAFIDFLKMDTEGNELKVLEGAKEMIEGGKIKFIQFEFGQFNIDSRTYFRDFWQTLSPYYTIHRIVKDGLYEIPKYDLALEIFLTSNFIAIKKG